MDNRYEMSRKSIKSFQDLIVYQNLNRAAKVVIKDIIPTLPKEERFDLVDQMRRASKGAPSLIAEGFAKRYFKRQWRKYINDCIGECNEMIHHLTMCIELYDQYVDTQKCKKAIDIYNTSCKQLTKLGQVWKNYHNDKE